MIDSAWSQEFAREWIAAWNTHDLERILSHYTDDFEMSSPLIIERMQEPTGKLKGKDQIRPYWQKGLAALPPLKFELLDVYTGVDSIVIYYRSINRKMVCEALFFNKQRQVVRGVAHYGGTAE
ncbi:MAG: nuclear transport factor 2 family protein [Hydrogenophilales bacterium]|nr:nuclear transport factor 2 family protein [Hydrogenophilales bacterium]MBZ0105707.1 nuclear transport factor 2 family protein [Sulfuricella denitrificans]